MHRCISIVSGMLYSYNYLLPNNFLSGISIVCPILWAFQGLHRQTGAVGVAVAVPEVAECSMASAEPRIIRGLGRVIRKNRSSTLCPCAIEGVSTSHQDEGQSDIFLDPC